MKKEFFSMIKNWFMLSRAPFLPAGILPFVAGSFLARNMGYAFSPAVFWWAFTAVTLTMVAANLNGEAYDIAEDSISVQQGKSIFAGGSGVGPEGGISPGSVAKAAWGILAVVLSIGLILQFGYNTGGLTLPLGITGVIAGFFYSKPPVRWVKRGVGELLIAYCYGWLPIAAGFYLQAGRLDASINLFCLPVAFSIFNVVFINEYLDYDADKQAGKLNLLVRSGREKGVYIYTAACAAAAISSIMSFGSGMPARGLFAAVPAVLIYCVTSFFMMRRGYRDRRRLESLCALTINANILFALSLIISFL